MANIAFITLYDKGCLGVRYLSSFLKRHGHDTSIIYLGRHEGVVKDKADSLPDKENLWISVNEYGADLVRSYSDPIGAADADILTALLKRINPDAVCFSLRTMFLETAIQLTASIRSHLKVPVVYGGIATACEPERCIKYADAICLGEGERAILMIADALDSKSGFEDIGNLWVAGSGDIHKNPLFPPEQDLDSIPFPDYDAKDKFSINHSQLTENDQSIGNMSRFTYEIVTSRGCPFACSYCCNDLFRSLYKGHKTLRRRSVRNVIEELKEAKKRHNITVVMFKDEVFTFDIKWIEEFAVSYKKEIDLPFWCYTHPSFADPKIMKLLKGCGMFSATMGIQSGSENILYNIFNRPTPRQKIIDAARVLEDLHLPERPRFDFITNNPFETEMDRRATLEILMRLPKPVNFGLTKLSFIPATKIERMRREIKQPLEEADGDAYIFWNYLYLLNQYRFFPNSVIRFLSDSVFFRKRSRLLGILLIPKFLNVKFSHFIEKLMQVLPDGLLKMLKNIRRKIRRY